MFIPLNDSAPLKVIRFQFVTGALILLNVFVFLYTKYAVTPVQAAMIPLSYGAIPAVITDNAVLQGKLAVIPPEATLLSYMFLHGGWMHLIGNMLFLWVFADNVEDGFGHAGFVLFYLVCGVVAGLAHVALSPHSQLPLVGASGAVAGVLASYLLLFPRSRVLILLFGRIPLRLSALWVLAGWFVMQIFFALTATASKSGGTAWWAHIGGFIAGLLITLPLRPMLARRLRS